MGAVEGKTSKRSGSEDGAESAGLEEVATPLAFPDMQLPDWTRSAKEEAHAAGNGQMVQP